ncbi:MAG: TolC family protein [Pseudomonadota bacterium]
MNLRVVSGVLLLMLVSVGSATAQEMTLTLPQAIELAMERNIDIAVAGMDLQTFREEYRRAIASAIGDLKATAGYTRNLKKGAVFFSVPNATTGLPGPPQKITIGADNAFSSGLRFDQPLFSGGRVAAGMRGGKVQIEAGEERLKGTKEEVVFTVKRLFYAYLLADSTTAIQADNRKLSNEHLATIRERYRQGLDSDLVVLRQNVEVASAETALIQARNLKDLSLTNFQKILALDVDRPLTLVGKLDPPGGDLPSYETVGKAALEKNTEYAAARKMTLLSEEAHKVYRAERFPDLDGFVDYSWQGQSDDFAPGPTQRYDSLSAGLKLEWKLFTGGETRARIAEARIAINRARKEEEKIRREIQVQVKQQWLGVTEARERARSQETAVGEAERVLAATEVRYKQGHASQLELNDATFALNRARTIFAQASHDFWVARAGLERVTGASMEEIR